MQSNAFSASIESSRRLRHVLLGAFGSAFLCFVSLLGTASTSGASERFEGGQVVIKLNPGHTIEEVNLTWGTTTLDAYPEGNLYLLDAQSLGEEEEGLATLMSADPAIMEAEANYFEDTPEAVRYMVVTAIGGGFVDYEDQEIGQRIGLDLAHTSSNGFGITIGLLDSGVDTSHEALAGHLASDGYDFVGEDTDPSEEANALDDDGDGVVDEGYGHGTVVAGILALVAPEARILPVRVLDDEGRANAYTIAKAIRYALNHGADVINCSFGVPQHISIIGHEISYAVNTLGVPIVAGAGNENREEPPYYPGDDSKAIMVTALDSLDVKASFADYNGEVLVSAPGTGVRSAFPGGGWALAAGCSFAVPFVTGEAALILSRVPTMSPNAVENRIESAVDPIYQQPGNQPYSGKLGSGRIYLPDALSGLPTSGIANELSDARLRAFPNPSSGEVRLALPSSAGLGSADLPRAIILDANGRKIADARRDAGGFVWNGRDDNGPVAAGVYFARVELGAKIYSTPIRIVRGSR